MTNLTIEHLHAIFPNAPEGDIEEEFPFIINTLKRYDISNQLRMAAFFANVAKESGELFYVEEIADGWAYEGRSDLGNTEPGDGPRFKGHGYIQITGRHNHGKVAEALGIDCLNDPLLLTEPRWAWMSAGWYWRHGSSWGNLNEYADDGDFESTVLGVRGGPDADRKRYWNKALEVLPEDITLQAEPPPIDPEPVKPSDGTIIIDGYPAREADFTSQGWLYDKHTGAFIVLPPNVTVESKGKDDRWGRLTKGKVDEKPVETKKWEWPVANTPPKAGNYVDRHPDRYTWRADVEEWARYLVDAYPKQVWCNTYYDHPEGYNRTLTSFDVWNWSGRGWAIDSALGDEIFNLLFYYEGAPHIDWIIWKEVIYGAWNGWYGEPFGDGSEFMAHRDHIHVTYH